MLNVELYKLCQLDGTRYCDLCYFPPMWKVRHQLIEGRVGYTCEEHLPDVLMASYYGPPGDTVEVPAESD